MMIIIMMIVTMTIMMIIVMMIMMMTMMVKMIIVMMVILMMIMMMWTCLDGVQIKLHGEDTWMAVISVFESMFPELLSLSRMWFSGWFLVRQLMIFQILKYRSRDVDRLASFWFLHFLGGGVGGN